jgi:hypothetical protein
VNRESRPNPRSRQARLRPEAAHFYPGLTADTWVQAATMADMVWSIRLRHGLASAHLADRVLQPEHFEFRCGEGDNGTAGQPRRRVTDRTELHD